MHLLLVLATSAQVLIISDNTLAHTRAETRYFYYWFMENDTTLYTKLDYHRYNHVFEIDKLNGGQFTEF